VIRPGREGVVKAVMNGSKIRLGESAIRRAGFLG